MTFSDDDVTAFWSGAWSVPLRSACRWLAPDVQKRVSPEAPQPAWLRPLCVQRWAGQAVLARLAWMQAHPEAAAYRYSGPADEGDPSIPCWTEPPSVVADWRNLYIEDDERLLWRWVVEVERLLRISEAPPALLGEGEWARAALRVSARLGLVYYELKRRHKAMRARAMLRASLRAYITWDYRVAA